MKTLVECLRGLARGSVTGRALAEDALAGRRVLVAGLAIEPVLAAFASR